MSGKHLLFIQPLMNFSLPVISLPATGKTSRRVTPCFKRQRLKCPVAWGRSRRGAGHFVTWSQALFTACRPCVRNTLNLKASTCCFEVNTDKSQQIHGREAMRLSTSTLGTPGADTRIAPAGISQVAQGPPCCSLQQVPSGTKLSPSSTRFPLGFCTFSHRVVFRLCPQVVSCARLTQQRRLCLQPDRSRTALHRTPRSPVPQPEPERARITGTSAPRPRILTEVCRSRQLWTRQRKNLLFMRSKRSGLLCLSTAMKGSFIQQSYCSVLPCGYLTHSCGFSSYLWEKCVT